MNYEFDLEEWLPKFPLADSEANYSGEDITSPCDICNNEHLRRELRNQLDWGTPVPVDVFIHSIGEPENRFATKIGGLPYRPADSPWPKTEFGRSMGMIAQFNFTNSTDIVGELPGDLLLIFGDSSEEYGFGPFYFEWQNIGLSNLVTELPTDQMVVPASYGNRCRVNSYPEAMLKTGVDVRNEYPQLKGKDVWRTCWLLEYQAMQIGRFPFFIQERDNGVPGTPLCTISSVQPDVHKPYPWVNHKEPLCPEDEWRPSDGLMIGDLGCIYVFIDEDGELYADESCY